VDKNTGVRSDQTVALSSYGSATVYPDALRRISYIDLIPAGKVFRVAFSAVTAHALVKFLVRQMLEQLRKHRAASVHPALLPLRAIPPSTVFLAFSFQIVPAAKPIYLTANKLLTPNSRNFPRTAVFV
jgi:hypothetical protein